MDAISRKFEERQKKELKNLKSGNENFPEFAEDIHMVTWYAAGATLMKILREEGIIELEEVK